MIYQTAFFPLCWGKISSKYTSCKIFPVCVRKTTEITFLVCSSQSQTVQTNLFNDVYTHCPLWSWRNFTAVFQSFWTLQGAQCPDPFFVHEDVHIFFYLINFLYFLTYNVLFIPSGGRQKYCRNIWSLISLPKGNTSDRTTKKIILIFFFWWNPINKYVTVVILLLLF